MAGFAEITIEQGASFSTTITVNGADGSPTNLTSYTGAAQLRKSYYSTNATATFATSIDTVNATITLTLSAATTANIAPGRYVYDTTLRDTNGTVTRILEGVIDVSPSVTR